MDLNKLSRDEKIQLLETLSEMASRYESNKADFLFPDEGPYRRELYPKHVAVLNATGKYNQVAMLAANQVGKSLVAALLTYWHLTGKYPDWYEGKRFDHPVDIWCAGFKSNVRESIQFYLIGSVNDPTGGLLSDSDLAALPVRKPGVPDLFQDIYVNHVSGGQSRLTLKTYDEKVKAFQGARLDFIWLDEEPEDPKIYGECLTRLIAKKGQIFCTFTPLKGLSDVVLSFLQDGKLPENGIGSINNKFVANVTWDDVPHLSEEMKRELYNSFLPTQRDARSKGIPALGSGAIYPIPEDEITCKPFEIPEYWPRVYGLDVGWKKTAAVWAAINPDDHMIYIYGEYYRGYSEPSVHADAIKARGSWIGGVIDPASQGSSQKDGQKLLQTYRSLGLELVPANNAVNAGQLKVFQLLSSGRMKIFTTCTNLLAEYRIYRRDENGKVVKQNDHLMDAWRYLCMSGLDLARLEPDYEDEQYIDYHSDSARGKDKICGY